MASPQILVKILTMTKVLNGIDHFLQESRWQDELEGNIGLLTHLPATTAQGPSTASALHQLLGSRLIKLYGPQHGFVVDVQDNMVETQDFLHPHFKIPVHSLYGEVRVPTDEMLAGVDTIMVDLLDVGTRVYTYISTLFGLMKRAQELSKKIIILDRPNPIGGDLVEGQILSPDYKSFVGIAEIPMRHGLTMGEMAKYFKEIHNLDCDLCIVPVLGWQRSMSFDDYGQFWMNPSPNLSTPNGAYCFPGTVLYEGTNISEGRGTTRALEMTGFPGVCPFKMEQALQASLKETDLSGFILRPHLFHPTFQKHQGETCGGIFIEVQTPQSTNAWRFGQWLLRFWYQYLGDDFKWNDKPYEYEDRALAIDFINGGPDLRHWVEEQGSFKDLINIESHGLNDYNAKKKSCHLY